MYHTLQGGCLQLPPHDPSCAGVRSSSLADWLALNVDDYLRPPSKDNDHSHPIGKPVRSQ